MEIQQFLDVRKYVRLYLSPILRKPRLLKFLGALVAPLQTYRDRLTDAQYLAQEREARSNSQVIKFERILNTQFGTGTKIFINEAGNGDTLFLFNRVEVRPKYLYKRSEAHPLYLRNHHEQRSPYDFTVNVPQALYNTSLDKIRVAVERYKLAGISYRIRPY